MLSPGNADILIQTKWVSVIGTCHLFVVCSLKFPALCSWLHCEWFVFAGWFRPKWTIPWNAQSSQTTLMKRKCGFTGLTATRNLMAKPSGIWLRRQRRAQKLIWKFLPTTGKTAYMKGRKCKVSEDPQCCSYPVHLPISKKETRSSQKLRLKVHFRFFLWESSQSLLSIPGKSWVSFAHHISLCLFFILPLTFYLLGFNFRLCCPGSKARSEDRVSWMSQG